MRARIAKAPGLPLADAHALVGLLEADGHLAIVPNNAGATYRCYLALALRDDDADLLTSLHEKTGLGHLKKVPARASSRPQVVWSIGTKLECSVAANLLTDHPMRGRKRHEAAVWTDAVFRWSASRYSRDVALQRQLRHLHGLLREVRRYRERADPDPALAEEAGFLAYFGGFFTGEGCLTHGGGRPRAVMKLRRDDRGLLELFAKSFGIGTVRNGKARPPSHPTSIWTVTSAADLATAVEVLDSAHLMGRKLRQYKAWRRGATEVVDAARQGRRTNRTVLTAARNALAHASAYEPPSYSVPTDEDSRLLARAAYADVLRNWALESRANLTCMEYERYRKESAGLPGRNTLSRVFGSWAEALEAAGLSRPLEAPVKRRSARTRPPRASSSP